MEKTRLVKCSGCGKEIDMDYCSCSMVDGNWYFFCDKCEKTDKRTKTLQAVYKDTYEKQRR